MRKHLITVSIIVVVISAVLAYILFTTNLIPYAGSPEMNSINTLMRIMAGIAAIFFVLIVTFIVYTFIFFRRRKGEQGDGLPVKGNSRLELIWTLIPLVIVIGLASYGAVILNDINRPGQPDTELEIDVTAFRFGWLFQYPQYDIQTVQLGLPVNRRVLLRMQSRDVIHAFWIREFGPKKDIVPGMTTELHLTPLKTGRYFVECAELCGYGHTYMIAPVNVTSAEDFEKWVTTQSKPSPASTASPTATSAPQIPVTSIDLLAKNIAFNTNTITVPAGAQITINFDNQDTGVSHNFAAYTNSSATTLIFRGQIINGPAITTYNFTAPTTPGNYFFRCDPHPAQMNGTLVVQ